MILRAIDLIYTVSKKMWFNEWLNWMQHLLMSQKWQPHLISSFSSSSLQNEWFKVNGASARHHLNYWSKWNKQSSIRKQSACFHPMAGMVCFSPFSLSVWCNVTTAVKNQCDGWKGWMSGEAKTQKTAALTGHSMACFILHVLFFTGYAWRSCGQVAALQLSSSSTVKKPIEKKWASILPGLPLTFGKVNRAWFPL